MKTKNNFSVWLRAQVHRDDPVGDVARDFRDDPEGAGIRSIEAFKRRLQELRACEGAYRSLEQALAEWRAEARHGRI
jgi:hypothetical protein